MCARFDFTDAAKERLEQFLQTLPAFQNRENAVTALSLFPSGDVHPTEKAPVLSKGMQEGTLALSFPVWGFPGREGKPVINARAETVREKPMFREAAGRGRCIIPAGTFNEWNRKREKVTFFDKRTPLLFLAGIERLYPEGKRFCILTTAANRSMAPVHDRMPLVLPEDLALSWILEEERMREILTLTPRDLDRRQDYEQLSLF